VARIADFPALRAAGTGVGMSGSLVGSLVGVFAHTACGCDCYRCAGVRKEI